MEKVIKNIIVKLMIFDLINIFIFSIILPLSFCKCDLDTPINKNGVCNLTYCTEDEFKDGICSIDNDIIKTQWLNNIILFNDYKYRFCCFSINSKGDMIAEYSTEEKNGIRLFYGLKQDGNYFFKNSNDINFPTKIITIKDKDGNFSIRYESNSLFVSVNNITDTNEYLIGISLYYGNVELFNFESNNESFIETQDFTGYVIYSTSNQLIKLEYNDNNDNKNYYLHIFVGQIKEDVHYTNFYMVLQIYSFSKNIISINDGYQIIKTYQANVYGSRAISGYVSDFNLIVVLYYNQKFKIMTLDFNLTKILDKPMSDYTYISGDPGVFLKCFYLKNHLGVFVYYLTENDVYPQIKIKKIEKNNTEIKEKMNIQLNLEEGFQTQPLLNDLVKINDNRFTLIASSYEKTKLFILLFDLYNNDNNIKIRMYKIYLLDLYNLRIFREITSIIYNNYLAISLSACNSLPCDYSSDSNKENSNYFSFLMILNYINGTDSFIDISPYLIENKNVINTNNQNNFILKLQEGLKIDNNIFGYEILKEIKLINTINELLFFNIDGDGDKQLLNNNDILLENHEIKQKESIIKTNEDIYSIEYQFIIREPTYEKFNEYPVKIINYPENTDYNQTDEFEEKIFYSRINKVSFKLCNENCKNCEYLGTSNNHKCLTCINNTKKDENGNCSQEESISDVNIEVDTDCAKFYIEKTSNKKICLKKGENCPLDYAFYNETINQCMEYSSFENLLTINFSLYNSLDVNNVIYNLYKTTIIESYSGNDNLIIATQDSSIFQLTNSLNELNTKNGITSNDYSLSMIDLGECGNVLKKKYNIDEDTPLIIFKYEYLGDVASKRNIQYEVYNPITIEKMDLSVCDDEKINIYIPVSLGEETQELQKDLQNYGYDLFNPNDSFYQDICSPYTTVNGTDILLSDRRNYFFNDTETSCQHGCEYSGYSAETQHLKCECSPSTNDIETEEDTTSTDFDEKKIFTSFYEVIKYSNYKVLKCYNLVFNKDLFKSNYGSIIFICYFILYTFFNLLFFIKGFHNIKIYISNLVYSRNHNFTNYNNNKNRRMSLMNYKSKKRLSVIHVPPRKPKNNYIDKSSSEKSTHLNNNSNSYNITKEINLLKKKKNKARNSVLLINKKRISLLDSCSKLKRGSVCKLNDKVNSKITKRKSINNIYKVPKRNIIEPSTKKINKAKTISYFRGDNFSDYELNELEYKEAIEHDKRSFFKYYWSLIRREHLIIHTFFAYDDYNILSLKLSKCVFSCALDFALNVVFFFDETMSKIYLDYGKYNIIAQIPQALYTTIISEAIDVLLRYLCLTEKDMYRIKQIKEKKNLKDINKKIFKILRCIKLKFFGYFVFTTVFLVFFWYFVSAFCAVYKNTQIILFKDSFLSLFLSLLYPFGLYIVPSSLRIIALRDSKKSLQCLYKSSDIIPLI